MSGPSIHGNALRGSDIIQALGDALSRIRQEDRLTWGDLGAILGKSEDTVAKYADGTAEMGAVALYRAKQKFNGRFTGAADDLIDRGANAVTGQEAQSCLAKVLWGLSLALEDGDLSKAEIRANRSDLERARDMIDALLGKLKPSEVRG